jgi:MFS family permease
MMNSITDRASAARQRTPLNRSQIAGFWGAWAGWTLDGMDSFIYALVLTPALTELLPRSGFAATPANVGLAGSILFALFLVGWGLSFIWGPLADRFGRTRVLAGTIFTFAIFTGLAATSQNVWELGIYRFIAGVGIGGEWALAGTYVAEAWPEDRRKMGAGYLQTGYYAGFFLAAALNYTIGVHFGWRAMFLTGAVPVVCAIMILLRVKETEKWQKAEARPVRTKPLREILGPTYRRRTWVACALLTIAIIGLWAGAVYEPSAVIQLATRAGMTRWRRSQPACCQSRRSSVVLRCRQSPSASAAGKHWRSISRAWPLLSWVASGGRSICRTVSRRLSRGSRCSASSAATSRSSACGCRSSSRRACGRRPSHSAHRLAGLSVRG